MSKKTPRQKLDWIGSGAIHDLIAARQAGKSFREIIMIIHEKYGVSFTTARLCQVMKSVRDPEANNIGN